MSKEYGFMINTPFYFRSRLPMRRVVECHGASRLVLRKWVKNRIAQQFYFDNVSKTIKSQQWKGNSMEIQTQGRGSTLYMTTTNSRWW